MFPILGEQNVAELQQKDLPSNQRLLESDFQSFSLKALI